MPDNGFVCNRVGLGHKFGSRDCLPCAPPSRRIEIAREMIAFSNSIAVLTGAGISTDSGIPDFRGPNGVWTLDPDAERLSSINHYRTDPEVRRKSWMHYTSDWGDYEPNAGHRALARLDHRDQLLHIATQNIDRLHHASGVPAERISELHGNREEVACLGCGRIYPPHRIPFIYGEDCVHCDGMLKPNVVFFGEDLNDSVFSEAVHAAYACDLYLVIGTTLQVWPAAGLPARARENGTNVIYINGAPLPRSNRMKRMDLIGSISETLDQIVP